MRIKCVHGCKKWSGPLVKSVIVAAALSLGGIAPAFAEEETYANGIKSLFPLGDRFEVVKLSKEKIPFQGVGEIVARPKLAIELGDAFLDTGNLNAGFEMPGGAVWQPRLWAFGIYRTALQNFDNRPSSSEFEWANRLNLFANLQLTGTEKLVLGLRPLDANRPGKFTRYNFDGNEQGWESSFSLDITTLFFEGDFGSLYPNLDLDGVKPIDWGFTVGRQVINFQEGILINDTIDAVGIVRNSIISVPGASNVRLSFLYAWDSLDRSNGDDGVDANLLGFFATADTFKSTFNFDSGYAFAGSDSTADQLNVGMSAVQRIGNWSTAFRMNNSLAPGTDRTGISDGILLSGEFSVTVPESNDIFYVNPFVGVGKYRQLGREPISGGPLGSLGIMYASPSLGAYGAEINPFPDNNFGFAMGYQAFWDHFRRNMILEVAGRKRYTNGAANQNSIGVGVQVQQAIGQHFQVQAETFYALREGDSNNTGARLELLVVY
jgi:hypothetical protein